MNIQTLEINGKEISYFVRKSSKAKRLIVKIDNKNNVELVLPKYVTYKEGRQFILSKKEWIKKHLQNFSEKPEGFWFSGNLIKIEISEGEKNNLRFDVEKKILFCESKQKINEQQVYEAWLKISAKEYIPDRTFYLANAYGFKVNKITIRNQKTRWGSCNSKCNLSFNLSLMKFAGDIIDYVIIHELCHLKHMNHSEEFWTLVGSFIPDYKSKRKVLKDRSML